MIHIVALNHLSYTQLTTGRVLRVLAFWSDIAFSQVLMSKSDATAIAWHYLTYLRILRRHLIGKAHLFCLIRV